MVQGQRVGGRVGRFVVGVLGLALGTTGLAVVGSAPAQADVDPAPGTPATVSADALPTVQIDGVVWSQVTVGNTVYAGGSFTKARPAGAAAGTNETARNNLLAYNIETGALVTSFAPSLNGQVRTVTASPDGSRIYVGGDFTQADGQTRTRVAAYSTATGQLVSDFRPRASAAVRAIAATNSTVYLGGSFDAVNGVARASLAAVSATDGATLDWVADTDAPVTAMTLTHDRSGLVVGGRFQKVNGNSSVGMVSLDPTTAAMKPWDIEKTVRNWGDGGAVTGLAADADGVYGTAYNFYSDSRQFIEGGFRAEAATGKILWLNDCHGDSYSVFPTADAVYSAGHAHYCGNIGGFPETDPRSFYRGIATSKQATGTLTPDVHGYPSFTGQPSPTLLNWYPSFTAGTFTGQGQAGWSVTGSSDGSYVAFGGEFPRVNGTAQQGLVRFAVRSKAPLKSGPRSSSAALTPTVFTGKPGQARVSFQTTWDYDDENLTYKVFRNFKSLSDTPVYETTARTPFWKPQRLGFVDTTVAPGTRYTYRVFAFDSSGNSVTANSTAVDIPASTDSSPYANAVLGDSPDRFYRLNEASGATVFDWAKFNDATANATVTRGAAGGTGDANMAATFNGSDSLVADPVKIAGPNSFTLEGWFRTTTTSGGKIAGFGSSATGKSGSYDRHVFMRPNGRLVFGAYPNQIRTVESQQALNDGQWHYFAASLGSNGMRLSVDGKLVDYRTDTTSGQAYDGFWRIGGDNSWDGNAFFAGDIDDVATYPAPLTRQQVDNHWVASGRATTLPSSPSDTYGRTVFADSPELYWRLGETSGDQAADTTGNGYVGRYYDDVTKSVGGIAGTDSAVELGNDSGNVVSQVRSKNPQVFSQEVWINTTTTRGGRIFGFGDSGSSGYSGNYDRHLYMLDSGQVRFGLWTGRENLVTSPGRLNDGRWHHVVSQVSSSGMQMYVDGQLVATNPNTSAQGYDGFWKLGGDNAWGGYSTTRFRGRVDEAAVYSSPLSLAQVQAHYEAGGGTVPNNAPEAAYSYSTSDLTATFSSAGSRDSDGSIASYAWDFGDGSSSTEANPSHTFARTGDYQVKLTVTDNKGASGSVMHTVSVVAPNQVPTADFTSQASDLAVQFTDRSADPDGTIVSREWTFGDGSTSTEASPRHVYAAGGSYEVRLVVTDNRGGSGTTTATVTVQPPNSAPTASFTSSTDGLAASFDGTGSSDPDGSVASYAWDFGDGATSDVAAPRHTYAAAGTYTVTLRVKDNRGATSEATQATVTVAPRPNSAPTASFTSTTNGLGASFDASGSSDSDGTVQSYSWDFGDGSTGTGRTVSRTFAQSGTYQVRLTVTDDRGASGSATSQVTVTAPPVEEVLARDLFSRALSTGWGTADRGGAWTLSSSSANFAVANGAGQIKLNSAGAGSGATLNGVSGRDVDLTAAVQLSTAPSGGGTYAWLNGRGTAADNYRTSLLFRANGTVAAALTKTTGRTESSLGRVDIPGLTYAAGDKVRVRLQVTGSAPTQLRVKVWKDGTPEPADWAITRTDSTAVLQNPGPVGVWAYVSGSSTTVPTTVNFSDFKAVVAR